MKQIYSEATAQGVCWACKGKKGHWREDDAMQGGEPIPPYYRPCVYCNDTGLPGPEQLDKVELESEGKCTDCALALEDHPNWTQWGQVQYQNFPYGCLRAALKEIHRLKGSKTK